VTLGTRWLTRRVLGWALFDVASSTYVALVPVFFGLYFSSVIAGGKPSASAYWGVLAAASLVLAGILAPIVPLADRVLLTRAEYNRSAAPEHLLSLIKGNREKCRVFPNIARALDQARDPMIEMARLVDAQARAVRKLMEPQREAIRQAQLESAVAIDEAVEAIVSALDATGQADDTIIVYTSDNGYVWGEHREFAGKDSDFEESIRVPLIIRAPGLVGAPREESRLALNIDLAPTLAAAAGVTPTSPVDGASLLPLLRDEASPWRTDFLIEHFDFSSAGLFNYAGVRTDEWKYVEYPITGEAELYDLVNDPYELDSRHADPAYDGIKATLQSRLDELLTPPSR